MREQGRQGCGAARLGRDAQRAPQRLLRLRDLLVGDEGVEMRGR